MISRSGDVPWDAPLFACPEQPVIVAGPAEVPDGARARVTVVPADTPEEAFAAFRSRGMRRILCEGGPGLNRGLIAAGLVDELFLTLDPSLSGGDGLRLIAGEPVELVSRALGVPVFKLERWREKADAALDGALKEREAETGGAELAAALQRVGELTMENELLRAKMGQTPGPLARKRWR